MDERDTNTVAHEPRPRDILCVYSQADESFYLQLKKSLNLWERQGHVRWLELRPGDDLATTWQSHIKRADLILLLLSPDFFPDELCYQTMHLALQERVSRQVPVVPILVRAVNWRLSACKDLAIVPRNEQPIASWLLPDEAFASITTDLVRLVPALQMKDGSLPIRPRLFQARTLPREYVPRPKESDAIKRLLLSQHGKQTTAITTALRGAGGFGKTTLALALCHDVEIQAAFPDGILWVELGEQPPRSLDVLNGVLHSLEPSLSGAITLEEVRDRWRMALDGRICLLVIDDVWQAVALEPLLEGGPQCVRLVTTRNDQVLPDEVACIPVDAMEPGEAVTLLSQKFPEGTQLETFHPVIERLAKRLGYWPLLLALAQGTLALLVHYGQSVVQALAEVEQVYEAYGVDAFHLEQAGQRQRSIAACMEVSLQHLKQFAKPHYQAMERYQELAVFPEDTDIPISTLSIFWQGSGRLTLWETKDLCIHLHQLSLLLTCDLETGTIRLHDVLRNYLQGRNEVALPSLHVRLLSAYWQGLSLRRWAELPAHEHYLWRYLVLHLCSASRTEELQTTLTDLMYLTRKALYAGVSALEGDLLLVSTFLSAHETLPGAPFFSSLHRVIARISHLLRQAQTEASMGGLLLSYLGWWEPVFVAQRLCCLERELPSPLFLAWRPLPDRWSSVPIRTLYGHIGGVTSCAVSPDGRFIVSASNDRTLKVWDATTGEERLTLSGHIHLVASCVVSPDSRFIVSASSDRTLKVWDVVTGQERFTLGGHTGWVTSCAVSPDGRFIVSASLDEMLKVWDTATGEERLTLSGHTRGVRDCAVSPDGRFIVSASNDGTLKVWNAVTGEEQLTLSGHTREVTGCAVSPDGRILISASADETLKIWDAATGEERFTLSGHTREVTGCAVSPNGCFIISTSEDETLSVWDRGTGEKQLTLSGHTREVTGCAVSPDGRILISASADQTLKMWDATTGEERLTLSGHTRRARGSRVSSDGRFLISESSDGRPSVWDASTGEERLSLSPDGRWVTPKPSDGKRSMWDATTGEERLTLSGHTRRARGGWVSSDGRFLISESSDGMLSVRDAVTGQRLVTIEHSDEHSDEIEACAVSPDGCSVVTASRGGMILKVWNAATGEERLTLSGHTRRGMVSSDGRFLISPSADGTLKVLNVITGEEQFTLSDYTGWDTSCMAGPDGRFLVSASNDGTLKVWDAVTGEERLTLSGHTDGIRGCVVSPDGSFIVSASNDGTLKVWDAVTGEERLTLSGHIHAVTGCAVSPDASFIISASWDEALKVWDAVTGQERLTLSGHTGWVTGCAVSPDGRFIISTSWDKTLKAWDAQTGKCLLTFPVDGPLNGCAFYPDGEHLVACGRQGMYFLRLVV